MLNKGRLVKELTVLSNSRYDSVKFSEVTKLVAIMKQKFPLCENCNYQSVDNGYICGLTIQDKDGFSGTKLGRCPQYKWLEEWLGKL